MLTVWNSALVEGLSDRGKLLWWTLASCPGRLACGVVLKSLLDLGLRLGWTAEDFQKPMEELEATGLARFGIDCVWLPPLLAKRSLADPAFRKRIFRSLAKVPDPSVRAAICEALQPEGEEKRAVEESEKEARMRSRLCTVAGTSKKKERKSPLIPPKERKKKKKKKEDDISSSSPSPRRGNVSRTALVLETDLSACTNEQRTLEQESSRDHAHPRCVGAVPAIPPELKDLELYRTDENLLRRWPELYPAWKKAFPELDVLDQIRKAHTWELANPSRRKKDRPRYLTNWLNRAAAEARKNGTGQGLTVERMRELWPWSLDGFYTEEDWKLAKIHGCKSREEWFKYCLENGLEFSDWPPEELWIPETRDQFAWEKSQVREALERKKNGKCHK